MDARRFAPLAVRVVLASWLVIALAVVAAPSVAIAPAQAQAPAQPTTTLIVEDRDPNGVIPQPNSGQAPQASGDRGGWAQLTLLGLIVTFLVVMFGVIARSTVRHTRTNAPG